MGETAPPEGDKGNCRWCSLDPEKAGRRSRSLPPPCVMSRSVRPPPTPDSSGTDRQNQAPTDRPDGDRPSRAIKGPISSLSWRPAVSGLQSCLTPVPENNELVVFFIPSSAAGGEKVPLEAAQLDGGGGRRDKRRGPEGGKGEGQTLSIIHPPLRIAIRL